MPKLLVKVPGEPARELDLPPGIHQVGRSPAPISRSIIPPFESWWDDAALPYLRLLGILACCLAPAVLSLSFSLFI